MKYYILIYFLSLSFSAFTAEIYFNSVNYPPYFSKDLPNDGAAAEFIKQYTGQNNLNFKIRHVTYARQLELLKDKSQSISFITVFNKEEKPEIEGYEVADSVGKFFFCLASINKVKSPKFVDNKHLKFIFAKGLPFEKLLADHKIQYQYSTNILSSVKRVVVGRADVIITTESFLSYLTIKVPEARELSCKRTDIYGKTYLLISKDVSKIFNIQKYNEYIKENNYWDYEKKYIEKLKKSEIKKRSSTQTY